MLPTVITDTCNNKSTHRRQREISCRGLKLQCGNSESALKALKKAELSTQTSASKSPQQTSLVNILRTQFLHLIVNLCVTFLYILYLLRTQLEPYSRPELLPQLYIYYHVDIILFILVVPLYSIPTPSHSNVLQSHFF